MNIVCIVQARSGSSRLPGKIFLDLCGKPMLWHVVNRLRQSRRLSRIVVATTVESGDDAVESFCAENRIDCFRGSEHDVLDRYYRAAGIFKADSVVRITSDCPLIDPAVVDRVIGHYLENAGVFCGASNVVRRTYPRGLDTEVFSLPAICRAWNEASRPEHREHVTAYLYEHTEVFPVGSVEQSVDLSSLRWTVDERDDYEFVSRVYRSLYDAGKIFLSDDVLALLRREPELIKINQQVKQKVL